MGGDTGEIFLSELKYVMGFRNTGFTVLPAVETVNTIENFRNVYRFATNQVRDETAKDNRETVTCTKTQKTAKSSTLRCLRTHTIYWFS